VNGIAAPLFSVKPDRLLVNSLTPWFRVSRRRSVSSVNRTSLPVPLSIVAASPVILAAVRLPGALVLYLTGLGHTVPEVADGAAAPVSPLSRTVAETTVLVSGKAVPVFFSGRAPGLIGVYQMNATLPDDTPPKVEVIVQAGDRASVPFVIQP
jgi:hypothetical protein